MAFSNISRANHVNMEQQLESLGFSYLDNVPFCVDPRLQEANYDLSQAEALLARPPPPMTGLHSLDLSEICQMEKHFLAHLEKLEQEKQAKQEAEQKEIQEYLEKKKKENEEKEQRQREEQRENEKESTDTDDLSDKLGNDLKVSPDEKPLDTGKPDLDSQLQASNVSANVATEPPKNFNFADFEAESDPFERAELDTLDDLGILASVLQTTSQEVKNLACGPTYVTSTTNQQIPQQGVRYPTHYYPQMNYPGGMAGYQASVHYPSQRFTVPLQQPLGWEPAHGQSGLKNSKSFSDIHDEMKKEESGTPVSIFGMRKLSSRTPPPRPVPPRKPPTPTSTKVPTAVTHSTLDHWIPWPDLDGSSENSKHRGQSPKGPNILDGLTPDCAATCLKIHEMGFPLQRVVNVCKALGEDQQQMINYCLLVDKLADREKVSTEAAEKALLLHQVDETKASKHLQIFRQLSELGFDSLKIHDAIVKYDVNYEKTLESFL